MPLAYIDATGFHRARLDEIFAYLQANERGIYGANIDLAVDSIDGQALMRRAEDIDSCLSIAEAVYNGRSPAGAVGAQLARLVQLNGVTKTEPEHSTGEVTLSGTPGTFIPAESRLANATDATAVYETTADATIGGGGTVAVGVRSIDAGDIPGEAGDLTSILTVISGWDSVTNGSSVSRGNRGETDGQLRSRRSASVAGPSQSITDGMKAALLDLDDVQAVKIRENGEGTTQMLDDGATLVAHAIEVIVDGGADQDIADTMLLRKSMGVTMIGSESAVAEDSDGDPHTMKWNHPDNVAIFVEIVSASALSAETQELIAATIIKRGNGELDVDGDMPPGPDIGEDVSVDVIYEAITVLRRSSLPGLKVKVRISDAPAPTTDDDVDVGYKGRARWSAGNITFSP